MKLFHIAVPKGLRLNLWEDWNELLYFCFKIYYVLNILQCNFMLTIFQVIWRTTCLFTQMRGLTNALHVAEDLIKRPIFTLTG